MPDETAGSSTATETPEVGTPDSSAGTENTGQADHMIPKARFDEVNERMKTAEDTTRSLQSKLDEMTGRLNMLTEQNSREETPEDPPPGLDARQQAEWIVEQKVNRMLADKLGVSLEELKPIIESVPAAARTSVEAQWMQMSTAAGLDPNDDMTKLLVEGFGRRGATLQDAIAKTKAYLDERKPKEPEPPNMETGGVASPMITPDLTVFDKKSAHEAAVAGRKIPHRSTEEVMALMDRQRRGKA